MRKMTKTQVGQKFGKLTIVEILEEFTSSKKRLAKCICDCGNEKITAIEYLRFKGAQRTQSCGCQHLEKSLINLEKAKIVQFNSGIISDPMIATAKRVYKNYRDGDLSFDDFYQLSQQTCYYCGKPPSNKANCYINNSKKYNYGYTEQRLKDGYFIYNGLDRIDSSISHLKSNVVTSCFNCNRAKMDLSISDFFNMIENIYLLHIKK